MIEANVKELFPVVAFARGFTSDRGIVPATGYFFFRGNELRAWSGDAGVILKLPVEFPTATVSAALFHAQLSSLNDRGTEVVTVSATDRELKLKAGKFRSSIALVPTTEEEQAEVFRKPPKVSTWPMLPPEFWDRVSTIEFSSTKDMARKILRGVYWSPTGALFAADKNRVSHSVKAEPGCPDKMGLLMPDFLLTKLGSRRRSIERLYRSGGQLWAFMKDETVVFAQLWAEEFPLSTAGRILHETKVRAKAGGVWVTISPKEQLPLIFANLNTLMEAEGSSITMKIGKASVTWHARAQDHPTTIEETVAADVKGTFEGELAINGMLFCDAVTNISRKFWLEPGTNTIYFVDMKTEHVIVTVRGNSQAEPAEPEDEGDGE